MRKDESKTSANKNMVGLIFIKLIALYSLNNMVIFLQKKEFEKMYGLEKSHWWFKSRRNLILGLLKKTQHRGFIMDIGCGTGYNLFCLQKMFRKAIGIDVSKDALLFAKTRQTMSLALADVKKIPIKYNSADVVLALDVIEHVENDDDAIKEIRSILKKNGTLVLTVPAFGFLWSKHDDILHHKRRYNKKSIDELLAKNGFKLEKISYWNFALFLPVLFYKALNLNATDIKKTNKLLNALLSLALSLDNLLIKYINLPFGVSIVAKAKRL